MNLEERWEIASEVARLDRHDTITAEQFYHMGVCDALQEVCKTVPLIEPMLCDDIKKAFEVVCKQLVELQYREYRSTGGIVN